MKKSKLVAASRSAISFAATVGRMDADSEPIGTYLRRVVANDMADRRIVGTNPIEQ